MLIDDDYSNLPADPELAFIKLERKYRAELSEAERITPEDSVSGTYYLSYINRTHAAAQALTLPIFEHWKMPNHRSNLYDAYKEFSSEVEHYLVQMQVNHGRRINEYSVALDTPTRMKLHHHITQIRDTVARLDVTPRKKEALIACVTALSDEIDRDRTRFESFASLVLEVATTTGEAARKLKPLKDFVDTAAKLLGYAKEAEDARPALPAPQTRKRLIAPTRDVDPSEADADTEIPF